MNQPTISDDERRSDQVRFITTMFDTILAVDTQSRSSMYAFYEFFGQVDHPLGRRLPEMTNALWGTPFAMVGAASGPAPEMAVLEQEFINTHASYPVPLSAPGPKIDDFRSFLDFLADVVAAQVEKTQQLLAGVDRVSIGETDPAKKEEQAAVISAVFMLPRLMSAYALLTVWPGHIPSSKDTGESSRLAGCLYLIPFSIRDQVAEALNTAMRAPSKMDNSDWELSVLVQDTQDALAEQNETVRPSVRPPGP